MVGKFRGIVLNAWAFKKKVSVDQELLENKRRKKFDYSCQSSLKVQWRWKLYCFFSRPAIMNHLFFWKANSIHSINIFKSSIGQLSNRRFSGLIVYKSGQKRKLSNDRL
jgi:hypothetical protein